MVGLYQIPVLTNTTFQGVTTMFKFVNKQAICNFVNKQTYVIIQVLCNILILL